MSGQRIPRSVFEVSLRRSLAAFCFVNGLIPSVHDAEAVDTAYDEFTNFLDDALESSGVKLIPRKQDTDLPERPEAHKGMIPVQCFTDFAGLLIAAAGFAEFPAAVPSRKPGPASAVACLSNIRQRRTFFPIFNLPGRA